MDRRIWISAVVAVGIALIARELFQTKGAGTGEPAPGFTATTIEGRSISLSEFKGRSWVLLNFYRNS